jgi:hypothetical protein
LRTTSSSERVMIDCVYTVADVRYQIISELRLASTRQVESLMLSIGGFALLPSQV